MSPDKWILCRVGLFVSPRPLIGQALTYINRHIVARKLPRVKLEPVVGNLDLVAVNDFLLEDAVAVAQAIAPGGVVERGETVKEAGGETAETTVAEGGVVLLFDDVLDAEAEFTEASCGRR